MKKKILITGATDGIGRLAALQLAKDGHTLYIHGRNKDKLESTLKELNNVSRSSAHKTFLADLTDIQSILKMVDDINSSVNGLDVLVNNAGVFTSRQEKLANGLDIRFMVNYLAPVILTRELLPLLQKNNESRIINLSSAAQSSVLSSVLKGEKSLGAQEAYAQSKLALLMWSFELSEKYPEIDVVALNPGSLLNTKMVQEAYGRHWSPANKGAEIIAKLATVKPFDAFSGKYFDNDRGGVGPAHSDALDSGKVKALMNQTDALLNQLLK